GLAYATCLTLFVLANRLTTAADTIYLQSTAPLYLLVLGPWLLKEPVRPKDVGFMVAIGPRVGPLLHRSGGAGRHGTGSGSREHRCSRERVLLGAHGVRSQMDGRRCRAARFTGRRGCGRQSPRVRHVAAGGVAAGSSPNRRLGTDRVSRCLSDRGRIPFRDV